MSVALPTAPPTTTESHDRPLVVVLFDYVFEPDKPGASGLSDVVWEMAGPLAALGIDVHVVGPYPPGTVDPAGATLHRYDIPSWARRNVLGHLVQVWLGWRCIRSQVPHCDLIHCVEYLSSAVFTRLTPTPVVAATPGNIYERIASGSNPFDALTTHVLKWAVHTCAQRCAAINAISHDMKRWWVQTGAPAGRVVVIPRGVDGQTFRPMSDIAERVGWESTHKHVLYVGRFSREKGVDLLLDAFEPLAATRPDVQLHLIGYGPLSQDLHARATASPHADRIYVHGKQPKSALPAFYSAADVCVVPSRSEPLGRVVLEMMACGTPVVGARVGGIPDTITPDVGLLFERDAVQGLADALHTLLSDPERLHAMGQAARKRVEEHYTWGHITRRLRDEVYTLALANATAHAR